jgi:hypothetical protein
MSTEIDLDGNLKIFLGGSGPIHVLNVSFLNENVFVDSIATFDPNRENDVTLMSLSTLLSSNAHDLVDILAGFSDGGVQLLSFDMNCRSFAQIWTGSGQHCVLSTCMIDVQIDGTLVPFGLIGRSSGMVELRCLDPTRSVISDISEVCSPSTEIRSAS